MQPWLVRLAKHCLKLRLCLDRSVRKLLVLVLAALAASQASAQSLNGERLYQQRCGACHSIETNRVGPLHRSLIGRRAGTVDGYRYSPALAQASFNWTRATLDRWLRNPRAMVPGTRMGFSLASAAERQAIIEFLATQN